MVFFHKEHIHNCDFCNGKSNGDYDLYDKKSGIIRRVCRSCWERSGKYSVQKSKNFYAVVKAREGGFL